jgi:hypothetical protein
MIFILKSESPIDQVFWAERSTFGGGAGGSTAGGGIVWG